MNVLRNLEPRSAAPAGCSLIRLFAALLLAGCWGGPSIDPQLEARQREKSKQTIETAGLPVRGQPVAGSGAEEDEVEEDATGETPAPLDNPQTEEPAPPPDDETAPAPPEHFGDDSVRCGDGVLDSDEICDITIAAGEEGACPTECPTDDPCRPQELELRSCWTTCKIVAPAPGACE